MNLDIKYEDNDLLVIDKPSNLITYDILKSKKNTLINILSNNYPKLNKLNNCGIVHRLDKDTTGLLIIAKNKYSYLNLKNDFFLRKIKKKYIAVITGELITGNTIKKSISRNKIIRTKMSVNKFGKESITHYRIKKKMKLHTCVDIVTETGRTHQIRVHMSYIGHPIVGDLKYKNNSSNYKKSYFFLKKNNININRQALHANKLVFIHPINKKIIRIKSNIPNDINNLILSIESNQ